MREKSRAIVHLSIATLFWGMTFVVIKPLVRTISPLMLVGVRFLVASAVLTPFMLRRSKRIDRRILGRGAAMGMVLFCGYLLQTLGLKYTTAGKSAFITATYVILTPILVWPMLGKRPALGGIFPALAALVGMYLLADPSGGVNPGDGYTLLSAFCWALHLAMIDRYATGTRRLQLSFVQLATVAVAATAGAALTGDSWTVGGLPQIAGILYLAVPATVVVLLWQLRFQPMLGAAPSALIYVGEAVVASAGGVLLFGEALPWYGWLGGGLILASTAWMVMISRRSVPADRSGLP